MTGTRYECATAVVQLKAGETIAVPIKLKPNAKAGL